MITLPYLGHYTVKRTGQTVYHVDPPLPDGTIARGDEVKVGDVVLTCSATEHHMTRAHPIVGVAVEL